MKIENEISKTLMIPLYHKMLETKRNLDGLSSIMVDREAYRICQNIEYDFSIYDGDLLTRVGCCVRTNYFDEKVANFIDKHENAVVLNVGCGLDARYNRVFDKKPKFINSAFFYDIDLREVIELRKIHIKESNQNSFIIGNLLDDLWVNNIKQQHKNANFIVITEGVLMYIGNDEIKKYIRNLQILEKFEFWSDFSGSKLYEKKQRHKTISKIDVDIKSHIDSENEFIKLIDFAKVDLIDSLTYFKQHTRRYGLKGMLYNLMPSSYLKKFTFMAGFLINFYDI